MTYSEKKQRVYDTWVKCMKPGKESVLTRAMRRLDQREIDYMVEGCTSNNIYGLNQNTMGWTFLYCILKPHMTAPDPQGLD